jgi:hypothetical protein
VTLLSVFADVIPEPASKGLELWQAGGVVGMLVLVAVSVYFARNKWPKDPP